MGLSRSVWDHWLSGLARLGRVALLPLLALFSGLLPGQGNAWAGLTAYVVGQQTLPTASANQVTVDFSTVTLATETTAGRLSYSASPGSCTLLLFVCLNSGGSVSYTASSSLSGFSGHVMELDSGTTPNATTVTVNFTNPTPYVGFLWGVEFVSPDSMQVILTLANNSTITLKNCTDNSNTNCLAKYVDQNWFANVYNLVLGWLLGDVVTYYPVYVQYQPDDGVKIKSIQFKVLKCSGCGLLSLDAPQAFQVDSLNFTNTSVVPHHLEVSTTSAQPSTGTSVSYTIKACGDAACTPYITGISGTLSITGASASSQSFSIPAGQSSVTVSASASSAGKIGRAHV